MFLYDRLALFFGLSLSVILLFAASQAQAQILEIDRLEGYEDSSDQSAAAAWGGIAQDFASLESYPVLHNDNPFKSADRSAFSIETNDFLWTLPIKSIPQKETVGDNTTSHTTGHQNACLTFYSSSAASSMAMAGILPAIASNFGLALDVDCMPEAEEVVGFFKGVVDSIKIADLQEKLVCLLKDSEDACDLSQAPALRVDNPSEKVPEPTVSAAIWLGVATIGALSAKFKPHSNKEKQ